MCHLRKGRGFHLKEKNGWEAFMWDTCGKARGGPGDPLSCSSLLHGPPICLSPRQRPPTSGCDGHTGTLPAIGQTPLRAVNAIPHWAVSLSDFLSQWTPLLVKSLESPSRGRAGKTQSGTWGPCDADAPNAGLDWAGRAGDALTARGTRAAPDSRLRCSSPGRFTPSPRRSGPPPPRG